MTIHVLLPPERNKAFVVRQFLDPVNIHQILLHQLLFLDFRQHSNLAAETVHSNEPDHLIQDQNKPFRESLDPCLIIILRVGLSAG